MGLLALISLRTKIFTSDYSLYILSLYSIIGLGIGALTGCELDSVKIYGLPILMYILYSNFQARSVADYDRYIHFILLATLLVSILMYFQESPGHFEFSWTYAITRGRIGGYYLLGRENAVGPTVIASFVSIAFLSALYFYYSGKKKIIKPIYGALAFISFILVVITGSRSGLIASFAGFGVLIFTRAESKNRLKRWLTNINIIILVGCAAGVGFGVAMVALPDIMYRFSNFFDLSQDHSLLGRFILWKAALDVIDRNPFGYGPKYFVDFYSLTTHNEILGVFVATGILGVILFVSFVIIQFLRLLKLMVPEMAAIKYYFISLLFVIAIISMTENYSVSSTKLFNPLVYSILGIITSMRKYDSCKGNLSGMNVLRKVSPSRAVRNLEKTFSILQH